MTIWKFPLELVDVQEIEMPPDPEILTVQVQPRPDGFGEQIVLWAIVCPGGCFPKRTIEIFGTGREMNPVQEHPRRYIGTVQMARGRLVWHVFERLEK